MSSTPILRLVYYSLGVNNAYLGRLERADSAINRAVARGLEIEEFVMLRYDLAFLRGDQAGMDREAARARARPGAASWISNKEAFALAYLGRLRQAREVSARAVSEAEQTAQRERAALWGAGEAVREAFFGNLPKAKKRATAALEQSKDRAVEYGAALALAMSGDSSRSETLANDLEIRFPEDTAVQFSYLPRHSRAPCTESRRCIKGDRTASNGSSPRIRHATQRCQWGLRGAVSDLYARRGVSRRAPRR